MAFDLDAIRARLEQTESLFWENDCRDLEDMCEADLTFIRNAPGDIAALIAELERLHIEHSTMLHGGSTTPLDLDPIRKRLNALERGDSTDARPGTAFMANAPRDIARLVDEVKELRADVTALQSIIADVRRRNAELSAENEKLRAEIIIEY